MSRREQAKAALRAKFLGVGLERLASLSSALGELEARPDDAGASAALMREIHTLKGEAKLVGFDSVNDVAHVTEELLLRARDLPVERRGAVHAVILRGLDLMTEILVRVRNEDARPVSVEGFLADAETARRATTDAAPVAAEEAPRAAPVARQFMSMRGDSSIRIDVARLHGLTDLAGTLTLDHDRSEEIVASFESFVEGFVEGVDALEASVSALMRSSSSLATNPLLRDLAAQARELRRSRSLASRSVTRARAHHFEFRLQLQELDAQIRDLRLQPLATMFQQYPRAVRELASEQQKKIQLRIEGADVQVDKEVIERLADPLLHLIRNAVDHGVETPAERVAARKPETATLVLSARQLGPFVEIRIGDDGRGIDAEKIRRSVVRKGLMAEEMARSHSDEAMLAVLFEPGFSTLDTATDLSGRGVGLDVVKSHVEGLGGTVHLETELGLGTTFLLRAPIAMVFTRALLVACGEVLYAFPSESVVEVFHARSGDVETVGEGRAIRVEEGRVAVFDLRALTTGADATADDFCVVVVEHVGRKLAVIVGGFVGERQIVQRSFDAYLAGNRLLAGTAVMPSGALAILLDVGELVRLGRSASAATPVRGGAAPTRAAARVLVVDDSEVTRDLLCTILRAHGYEVFEAINGKDGLERIAEHEPQIVVTDLEMPIMDGFGLVAAVRSRAEWKALPLVVFSTRGSEADKRKASQLGADAYLVKGSFREEDLLALVRRYVGAAGS